MSYEDKILVNGYPVVISISHKTKRNGGGWQASQFIAECTSLEDISVVVNDPNNSPGDGWEWDIQFQDKVGE